jgi:hypothetical protein
MSKTPAQDMSALCDCETFTITHPFHPHRGIETRVAGISKNSGGIHVRYVAPDGTENSVRASWTDLPVGKSPSSGATAGTVTTFSYESLVELSRALAAVRGEMSSVEARGLA